MRSGSCLMVWYLEPGDLTAELSRVLTSTIFLASLGRKWWYNKTMKREYSSPGTSLSLLKLLMWLEEGRLIWLPLSIPWLSRISCPCSKGSHVDGRGQHWEDVLCCSEASSVLNLALVQLLVSFLLASGLVVVDHLALRWQQLALL